MKKSQFFLAAALVLAACSSDELGENTPQSQSQADPSAVGFDVYTPRVTTRGGYVGIIGNTQLQAPRGTDGAYGGGFGVFAYYTDNNDYDPQSQPNFLYNQFVGYNATNGLWEYDPIKYWPNEYGSDAISDDADRVSFFAYAPYVDVIPSTGKLIKQPTSDEDKWGITGMTRNSATGDPIVKYIASFDQDKSVDLLWGTVGASKKQWDVVQSDVTLELDEGLPWLNVQRPREAATQAEATQRVTFQFEHALAQLSINIDADVDEAGHSHANDLNSKTRIWVRSVTFNGFAIKGALDLNNTEAGAKKAYWLDYNGTADLINGEAITVHDGLKDGKEGTDGAFASNEKTLGLNPQIIQSNSDITNPGDATSAVWNAANKGVTKDAVSLFRKKVGNEYTESDKPVTVIPTGDDFDIEIVYDVETIDGNLSSYVSDGKTPGNSIENRIRKSVTFGGESVLENGKHYTLNLHLGMNSVKLDANVSAWQEAEAQAEPDLPLNVPAYAAQANGSTPVPNVVELTATTTKYEFAMTGLYGGETVTASTASGNFSAPSTNAANTSGVAIQSITIAENTTIQDQAKVGMRWTGASSGSFVSFHFVQKAHVIGLSANELAAEGDITLNSTAAGIDWSLVTLTIKKNGVLLAQGTDYTVADNVITLTTAAVVGDTYTITASSEDVPDETITVKCK